MLSAGIHSFGGGTTTRSRPRRSGAPKRPSIGSTPPSTRWACACRGRRPISSRPVPASGGLVPPAREPPVESPRRVKTLYRATRVRTMTFPPEGEWVLVDERHVERVGIGEPPPADRTVELPGTTIFPGFVDAHVHLSGTGMLMAGLDLAGARSREEALDLVRRHVGSGPVLGQGFDETTWPDPELLTRAELDVVSDRPLLLVRADGYVSLVNTATIGAAGVEELEGVERDAGGEPTGRLRGEANTVAQLWYFDTLPDRVIQEAQLRAAGLAAARGVTCVHEMAIPDKRGRRDVVVLLSHADHLPVDLIPYVGDRDLPWVVGGP